MKYFPVLSNAKIVRTWAGWMDKCADGVPVLGNVEEVPGLVLACGFSGHGFGIVPGASHQLAELITTGKTDVDLYDLRYDRFGFHFFSHRRSQPLSLYCRGMDQTRCNY